MSNKLISGAPVSIESLSLAQEDAADRLNNIELDHISRGTFGPEHMVDSVVFTARDFSSEVSTTVCQYGGAWGEVDGALSRSFPMTVSSYYWGRDVTGPDFVSTWDERSINNTTNDYNDSVVMHLDRRHWHLIPCASSKNFSEWVRAEYPAAASSSLDRVTSTDWTEGSFLFEKYSSKFGNDLFKIGNNGKDFALMFNCNFEIKNASTFPTDGKGLASAAGSNRWRRWEGGCRVWTSIVYFLKPNPDAPFVLKWSPRHMIGCSASSYNDKEDLNSPMINEVHSYQDVIQVNQTMIDSLCEMSGVYNTGFPGMQLSGDASFGWAALAGIDRWDGLSPDDERVDGFSSDVLSAYKYNGGQPVTIDNGNCSFVAFNYSAPTNDKNISLYNNFIGR